MNFLQRRDGRDIVAGLLMIAIGVFSAIYATIQYPIGTVQRMGPGMFPMAAGWLLAIIGLLIALPAFFRSGGLPKVEGRPFFFVLLAAIVFGLTVERLGVVPAIFLLTGLSVLGDNKLGIVGTLVLASCISAGAVLIFLVGLGIPIYPFVWPF